MTITINYSPHHAPGYTPRKAVTLHNVAAVHDKSVGAVEVRMMFADAHPTHDHVVSVVIIPEKE